MTEDWARPVVHWDIRALDPELLRNFYSQLFNWEIGNGPFMQIPPGMGGPEPGPAGHIMQGERGGVALYIQVKALKASMQRAVELGGTVLMDPIDIPNQPTVAGIADPEGNPVMLVQQ